MKKGLLLAAFALAGLAGTASAQSYFSQDFEGGTLPTGWDTTYTSANPTLWQFSALGTPATNSQYFNPGAHSKVAILNDDIDSSKKANPAWLITSDFSIPSTATNPVLSFDQYFGRNTLNQAGTLAESTTIWISSDAGATWTILDSVPRGGWITHYTGLGTSHNGQTVRLGIKYRDENQWAYGIALDNINVAEAPATNLTFAAGSFSIDKSYYLPSSTMAISGFVRNNGTASANAYVLNYKIDNGAVQTVSGTLSPALATNKFQQITNNTIGVGAVGAHTLTLWIKSTNGVAETNVLGDSATFNYNVAANLANRHLTLIEHFTQASCPPCATQNPRLNALLNTRPDVVAVKYQTVWPGVDPMNAQNKTDVAARVTYYNVTGVPTSAVNGNFYNGYPASVDATMFDNAFPVKTPMTITLSNVTMNGTTVSGTATVNLAAAKSASSNIVVRCAIVEKNVYFASAPGTNGEKEFQSVMRKLAPDPAGVPVTATNAGSNQTINFTWTGMTPSKINNRAEIRMVVWIQDEATQEVYDANSTGQINLGVDEATAYEGMELDQNYPNPANDNTFIKFVDVKNTMTLRITDVMGRTVMTRNIAPGTGLMEINTESFANGVYSYSLYSNDAMVSTKKMTVAH